MYFGSSNGYVYALNKQAMLNVPRPSIFVKIPSTNDLGILKANESIKPNFYVYNSGEAPDSLSISSSNGKIAVTDYEKTLVPGDSVKLEFTVDATLFGNKPVTFYLFVTSNKSMLSTKISVKYTFYIAQETSHIAESEDEGKLTLGPNYPNPFSECTYIPFNLATSGKVTLKLYSSEGREIQVIQAGTMAAGNHIIELRDSSLSPGNYYYSLLTDDQQITRKLTVMP